MITSENFEVERGKLISWAEHYDDRIKRAKQKITNALYELEDIAEEAQNNLNEIDPELLALADFDFALNYLKALAVKIDDEFHYQIRNTIALKDWLGCRSDAALTRFHAQRHELAED